MNDNIEVFIKDLFRSHRDKLECAPNQEVVNFYKHLIGILFPDFNHEKIIMVSQIKEGLQQARLNLVAILCKDTHHKDRDTGKIADDFINALPEVYKKLLQDIEAIYIGDPAATSFAEVTRTYPGFYAIMTYRIAHVLYDLDLAIIPRIITEYAHSLTGIDIHPGAEIGRYFCIDHGTGVVIGETCHIGDHVKIYQGVTLGALSVDKKDVRVKRHPTLEDHVVLYAGATILGGETVIGHHSIIGGNAWITKSIKPHSKVYYKAKMYDETEDETDLIIYKSIEL